MLENKENYPKKPDINNLLGKLKQKIGKESHEDINKENISLEKAFQISEKINKLADNCNLADIKEILELIFNVNSLNVFKIESELLVQITGDYIPDKLSHIRKNILKMKDKYIFRGQNNYFQVGEYIFYLAGARKYNLETTKQVLNISSPGLKLLVYILQQNKKNEIRKEFNYGNLAYI